MSNYTRYRRTLHLPISLSVVLMAFNIALMVVWIVLLAQLYWWSALAIGTVVFVLILVGLSFYLALVIKEVRLNQRQANFVDSVTHELKSPIATLRLYLETLQMRTVEETQRSQFYDVMQAELQRLDHLISQLLEVGRLDAIGEQAEVEDVELEPVLRRCAHAACAQHGCVDAKVFSFDVEPAVVRARRLMLEMVFGNLLDNATKYAGAQPAVDVEVRVKDRGRVVTRVSDNGEGVPIELRSKIFNIFVRGGDELERRRSGAGLGLYIVHTLVNKMNGRIGIHDRDEGAGSVFEVELPGRALPCEP